jgi:hypothetical protein
MLSNMLDKKNGQTLWIENLPVHNALTTWCKIPDLDL